MALHFWTRVVGLDLLGRFDDHEGYDGIILGYLNETWELELTWHTSNAIHSAPTDEDIIVLYMSASLADDLHHRLHAAAFPSRSHANPYWEANGATIYTDPDGYALIVFPTK